MAQQHIHSHIRESQESRGLPHSLCLYIYTYTHTIIYERVCSSIRVVHSRSVSHHWLVLLGLVLGLVGSRLLSALPVNHIHDTG